MGEFLDFSYEDYKYKLFVPGNYQEDKETPLLVMLHGCDQNPDDFAAGTNMNVLAEKENFLVLYPDMNHMFNPSNPAGYNPFGCWNWFLDKNQHRGKGHPKLIVDMIEEVKASYNIDKNRIYATGLSAGASLACILGVTYPDVFSGIGIFAGLAYSAASVFFLTDPMAEAAKKSMQKGVTDPYTCGNNAFSEMGEFKKKMPIIVFHGLCDIIVHPINGKQAIIQWGQTNFLAAGGAGKAEVNPVEVHADISNGKSYIQHVYNDEHGEPLMELWLVDQLGHAWSGGNPAGSYTDPMGPNASEIIWKFFTKNQHQQEDIREDSQMEIPSSEALEEVSVQISNEMAEEPPAAVLSETPVIAQPEDAPGEPISTRGEPGDMPVKTRAKSPIRHIIRAIMKFVKRDS